MTHRRSQWFDCIFGISSVLMLTFSSFTLADPPVNAEIVGELNIGALNSDELNDVRFRVTVEINSTSITLLSEKGGYGEDFLKSIGLIRDTPESSTESSFVDNGLDNGLHYESFVGEGGNFNGQNVPASLRAVIPSSFTLGSWNRNAGRGEGSPYVRVALQSQGTESISEDIMQSYIEFRANCYPTARYLSSPNQMDVRVRIYQRVEDNSGVVALPDEFELPLGNYSRTEEPKHQNSGEVDNQRKTVVGYPHHLSN